MSDEVTEATGASQAPVERFAKVESFLFEVGFTCFELAVLTALKNHAPNIRPSIDLLTREAGMSRSMVKKSLRTLAEMGAIEVHRNFDDHGGQFPNSYRLTLDRVRGTHRGNQPNGDGKEVDLQENILGGAPQNWGEVTTGLEGRSSWDRGEGATEPQIDQENRSRVIDQSNRSMINPMGQQQGCRLDVVVVEEAVSEAAANESQVRAALKAALDLFVDGETHFGEYDNDPAEWLQFSPTSRAELLSAAVRCCREHGYDETVSRIASRLNLAHGHHWERMLPVRIPVGAWFGGALWHGCDGLYGEGELNGNCGYLGNPEMQWNEEGQAWEVNTDWWCNGSDLRDQWDGWSHAAPPDPPTALDRPPGPQPLRILFPSSVEGLQRLQGAIEDHGSGAALATALDVSQQAVSCRLKTLREKFGVAT